jgi:hypothetical protein
LTTISQLNFHCGHIVAEINGGSTKLDNIIPICQYCNLSIGNQKFTGFYAVSRVLIGGNAQIFKKWNQAILKKQEQIRRKTEKTTY